MQRYIARMNGHDPDRPEEENVNGDLRHTRSAQAVRKEPRDIVHLVPIGPATDIRTLAAEPALAAFADFYRSLPATGGVPDRRALDMPRLTPWLGHIVIAEPAGEHFRYRLFGTTVALILGRDMTGAVTSSIPERYRRVATDAYRVCLGERRMVFTHHVVDAERPIGWERLVVPIAENGFLQAMALNYAFDLESGAPLSPRRLGNA